VKLKTQIFGVLQDNFKHQRKISMCQCWRIKNRRLRKDTQGKDQRVIKVPEWRKSARVAGNSDEEK